MTLMLRIVAALCFLVLSIEAGAVPNKIPSLADMAEASTYEARARIIQECEGIKVIRAALDEGIQGKQLATLGKLQREEIAKRSELAIHGLPRSTRKSAIKSIEKAHDGLISTGIPNNAAAHMEIISYGRQHDWFGGGVEGMWRQRLFERLLLKLIDSSD